MFFLFKTKWFNRVYEHIRNNLLWYLRNSSNEAQQKDLEKRKVVINTAFKLYDKLLNM